MLKRVAASFISIVWFAALAHAQGLGSIVGTVTDPSGAAIASAKIKATQTGTSFSRKAQTNADGYFVISFLNPNTYTVSTEAPGFSVARQDVTLLADQTLTFAAAAERSQPPPLRLRALQL